LALASEDHYLRVYTARGDTLVHHRFDALAELGDAGVRVHRSWWVARAAVTGSEREGERIVLLLSNGLRVPVSRTYLIPAREAGLIAAATH
jgi:DNA-binding LytR/AlgR family response regulator